MSYLYHNRAPRIQHSNVNFSVTPKTSTINLWNMSNFNSVYVDFLSVDGRSTGRLLRQEYCFRRFFRYFYHNVLDVGCDAGVIRKFHYGNYVGIDLYGKPDVVVNLDSCRYLPFADNSFDTIVCVEVLEHIDHLHEIFDEMVRVIRNEGVIIVSLPNCMRHVFGVIMTGSSCKVEYGLPLIKPKDRHKWFFNPIEAMSFIDYQAVKHGLSLIEIEHVTNAGSLFQYKIKLKNLSRVLSYPPTTHPNKRDLLERIFLMFATLVERFCEFIFLRPKQWRKQMRIVNTFFVLKCKK